MEVEDVADHLPERIWYLSSNGQDLYCRRPYSFLFSNSDAAVAFGKAMGVTDLTAVGIDAKELASDDLIMAFHSMQVTRVFIDPQIDEASGDVHGTILRLQEPH